MTMPLPYEEEYPEQKGGDIGHTLNERNRSRSSSRSISNTKLLGMDLSFEEAMAFCDLSFVIQKSNSEKKLSQSRLENKLIYNELKTLQTSMRFQLAEALETGKYNGETIAKDSWRSAELLAQATTRKPELPSSLQRTKSAYLYLGFYTSIRLFALRFNRLLTFKRIDMRPEFTKALFPFDFLGFSYGLELLVDLGVICGALKARYYDHDKSIDIKATVLKDDRFFRMLNATFWLACNVTCFIVTAGMAHATAFLINAIVNLATFTFDVFNEHFRGKSQVKKYESLQAKIRLRIDYLETEINNYKHVNSDIVKSDENELNNLRATDLKLTEKIAAMRQNRWRTVGLSLAIVAGMALFFFPPTAALGLTGALIAFTAGSVFMGLGKRLFKIYEDRKTKQSEQNKKSVDQEELPILSPSPTPVVNTPAIIRKIKQHELQPLAKQLSVLREVEREKVKRTLGLEKKGAWEKQIKLWTDHSIIERKRADSGKLKPPTPTPTSVNFHATFLETLESKAVTEEKQVAAALSIRHFYG